MSVKALVLRLMIPISLASIVTACGDDSANAPVTEPIIRPVKLMTVTRSDLRLSNRYPAVIDAAQSSELTFEVGGLVEKVLVTESQDVEKGTVIATLRQRDFRNNLKSAKAQFDNAEAEYQRALRLSKENAIAKNVLEQRKAQRDVAKSSFDSASKALEDTILRAPFSGAIATLPIKALQTVQPGTVVTSVIDLKTLEASIDLPASIIATVEQRQDRQAFVVLDAAPETKVEAVFKEATLVADAISQTYSVTFSFSAPDDLLILPGMNATMILESSRLLAASNVVLPLAAILSDGDQRFVWVVDQQSMTVSKREVQLEPGIGDTLIVKEGLAAGEVIVGAGAAYLSEGVEIRSWEK